MRRFGEYDPDEGGRYDGDDDPRRHRGCCETAEEIGARMDVLRLEREAMNARLYRTPQPGERGCPTCRGRGDLIDRDGMTRCYACGGSGTLT